MSRWKQLARPPKGALPGGIVTKAGIALIGVLVAGLILSWSITGPAEDEAGTGAPPDAQAVDEGMGRAFGRGLRAEAERQTQQAAADTARAALERRRAAAAEETAGAGAETGSGDGAGGALGLTQAEHELREALRLEEIERRTRSLRSLPVAQSHRDPSEVRARAGVSPAFLESPSDPLDAALEGALASFERSVAVLEDEMAAGLVGGQPLPGSPGVAAPNAHDPAGAAEPARLAWPTDPPGWQRIREGSFLEAVLLTQLSGEFPGPVLAMASVPLYSTDRQHVLIPRGARVVGTASAVQHRDQSRLAVAFHRLLLPDGGSIALAFQGLNQAGESALSDEVNRRYLSTFTAAGAVGALSGLALAGASPYGLRAGAGQGLAGSAMSVLDGYLNRLPEITIRAGHRLRIWFTADVLVPGPGTTPPTH